MAVAVATPLSYGDEGPVAIPVDVDVDVDVPVGPPLDEWSDDDEWPHSNAAAPKAKTPMEARARRLHPMMRGGYSNLPAKATRVTSQRSYHFP